MKVYKAKNRLKANEYIDGVLGGDTTILSRAITLIESNLDVDKELSKEVIQKILPSTGKSIRIGITGIPGVGKSTFIESFGKNIVSKGHNVAVLAVDPSSSISNGSILGDKTRMEDLANLDNVYIRPSASGKTLGGVASKTGEAMLLCEAAGYDVILIETVGVGQSETAVAKMTDFFLLLMLAGAGDELQGIKKGIMEMADMIVINKADGDNIKMCEMAKLQYQNAIHMFSKSKSEWLPVVSTVSATNNYGIDYVWDMVMNYKEIVTKNGFFDNNRTDQKIKWMYSNINESLEHMLYEKKHIQDMLKIYEQELINSKMSPVKAAEMIIDEFKRNFDGSCIQQ